MVSWGFWRPWFQWWLEVFGQVNVLTSSSPPYACLKWWTAVSGFQESSLYIQCFFSRVSGSKATRVQEKWLIIVKRWVTARQFYWDWRNRPCDTGDSAPIGLAGWGTFRDFQKTQARRLPLQVTLAIDVALLKLHIVISFISTTLKV